MKTFEAALDTVIKQFGKDIITEKRFVSVLADYNAFYNTPAVRDILVMCIYDGFLQELYSIYYRKYILGGSDKKYDDVKKCVTLYKGSLKNGSKKNIADDVIDLIASKIIDGYNSTLVGNKHKNTVSNKKSARFHIRKKYLFGSLLLLLCTFGSYYYYSLNKAIQHNTEIERKRQTEVISLSYKGITLGNNIEKEFSDIGFGFDRDIYGKQEITYESEWSNYGQLNYSDCEYFSFKSFLNKKEIYVTIKAFKKTIYEIELNRESVEGIEHDYIKKYGEPSTDNLQLILSVFYHTNPRILNWKFKNETITITSFTIRYYQPEILKLVDIYKKEKKEEARQKTLQKERDDSIREAEQLKEDQKKEREAKLKQLNDI